ncbi:hypothetical protein AK829_04175 [Corynebacterium riegelii]|uniref:Uncharacterized protein n=1 Tax=Corynebacterium riegelii TaxID=156976 RepID=A0A0K1RAQ3_9CORY|nr:hypothetical protein AK829_04175 [Corynebacterium riegelii]
MVAMAVEPCPWLELIRAMSVGFSWSLAYDVVNPFMVGLKLGFSVQPSGSSIEMRPSWTRCMPLVSD